MDEIICKTCGHAANKHPENAVYCTGEFCNCIFRESEVLRIYIIELQARLDTNRAQVNALISKRDEFQNAVISLIDEELYKNGINANGLTLPGKISHFGYKISELKAVEKDFQILLSICDCFDFINPDAEQVEKVREMLVKYVS